MQLHWREKSGMNGRFGVNFVVLNIMYHIKVTYVMNLYVQAKHDAMESTFIYQRNVMSKMTDERFKMIKKLDHASGLEGKTPSPSHASSGQCSSLRIPF